MGATGTIRVNRSEHCPLEDIKYIKKKNRGSMEFQNSKNLKMVQWNENRIVLLTSNCYGFEPVAETNRWSNIDKRLLEIDQTYIVSQYNKFMGCADRMDQNISQYWSKNSRGDCFRLA
ncbi:piggyBac transposable element-derived protein 3-like [Nephila pilipes]|uniref:PiggyBac transposable element-derived protein 3-like n=1 Tax=Nephila pilipes TaxID=299642 RepID=A0A8X6PE37_NEPPI|nr:piggyBac transposable element-derived protein 3-like [Nephila pilipes]